MDPLELCASVRHLLRDDYVDLIIGLGAATADFFYGCVAALGLGNGLRYFSASALVVGVFIGSSLLFLLLSSGVTLSINKLDLVGLQWVNKIAGVLIIFSGIGVMMSLI
ncbi:MAG: hypothetical protein WAV89_01205 [Ignavibacteriaceae bacterium]